MQQLTSVQDAMYCSPFDGSILISFYEERKNSFIFLSVKLKYFFTKEFLWMK